MSNFEGGIRVNAFVSGGFLFTSWVLDGVQLLGWTLLRRPLSCLYSPYALFPSYALVLIATLVPFTLTWTVWADWSTSALNRCAP